MISEFAKELMPTGDPGQVLKHFEDKYFFSKYDDLIYFITWDLDRVKSFDEKIKVKFGKSNGSFERRWEAYSHHSPVIPFLIAVITIPKMDHYKLFFPETDYKDVPHTMNEEKKVKNLFKDRTYLGKSKEKVEVTLNEVCDYFEKRQKELNDMYEEYQAQELFWNIPFQGSDGKMHDRISYHYELDNLERNPEKKCSACKGTGTFYKRGKYPNFFTCESCRGEGVVVERLDDTIALEKSILNNYKPIDIGDYDG